MDEIIREPLGAAHADPMAAFPYIKDAILRIWHTKRAPLPVKGFLGWQGLSWVLRYRLEVHTSTSLQYVLS